MTEALFSRFLMVDQDFTSLSGRTSSRPAADRTDASKRGERELREAFAQAFLEVMVRTAPKKGAVARGAAAKIAELASAFADVATGGSVVLRLKPDLGEGQRDAIRTFLETVVRVSGSLEESRFEAAIGKLAEVILPDELADARGPLASDNLELRDRFIAQVPQLTSVEVGARAGLRTRNPYATAARWKKAGDIFSVQHRGTEYFPAFQFRDGRPHPTVRKALAALPPRLSAWQQAFWFVSTNGWWGDKAPADVLDDADAVVAAGEREGQEVVG